MSHQLDLDAHPLERDLGVFAVAADLGFAHGERTRNRPPRRRPHSRRSGCGWAWSSSHSSPHAEVYTHIQPASGQDTTRTPCSRSSMPRTCVCCCGAGRGVRLARRGSHPVGAGAAQLVEISAQGGTPVTARQANIVVSPCTDLQMSRTTVVGFAGPWRPAQVVVEPLTV